MKSTKSLTPQVTAVLGLQWGDEGKGKLIDILARNFDYVVRATGGANAGHTVHFKQGHETKKIIFHLIPSGIIQKSTTCVIGNGCCLHLPTLFEEIAELKKLGINIKNRLLISDRAHLLLEYHKKIDALQEKLKGNQKIGTTLRGIGPCYSDKINRLGIRLGDLKDFPEFEKKFRANLTFHENLYGALDININQELKLYRNYAKMLSKHTVDTSYLLSQALQKGQKILLEGANGSLLDIDHGTYPFVTSSNASIGGLYTGSGIAPKYATETIGVIKAYTTRVGAGPFPTELNDKLGNQIREAGCEYGATTGRPRRCGWFDAFLVKYASSINGVSNLNLTKIDVLSSLKTLKIAISYTYNGRKLQTFPSSLTILEKIKPQYIELPGWQQDISNITEYRKLPPNCDRYVETIEKLLQIPIKYIGVGQRRDQIIIKS